MNSSNVAGSADHVGATSDSNSKNITRKDGRIFLEVDVVLEDISLIIQHKYL